MALPGQNACLSQRVPQIVAPVFIGLQMFNAGSSSNAGHLAVTKPVYSLNEAMPYDAISA